MADDYRNYDIHVDASRSGEADTTCPRCSHTRHKSKDKCLSVNLDRGTWLCHHCGWSGGLKEDNAWGDFRHRNPVKTYVRPSYSYDEFQDPMLYDFFKKRGISPEVLENEKVSLSNGWINFPYIRDGVVINVKHRGVAEKKFFQEKGAEKILYGMVPIPENENPDHLIWVEGEIDRLSLLEAGFKYVVSVPDGAPTPGSKGGAKLDFLETCEDYIWRFKEHIIAVDTDAPGVALREELARRLGVEKCRRVVWSNDCKDANEVLVKFGKKTVESEINAARYFPVDGVCEVRDILPDAFKLYDDGITRGVKTGWPSVDKYLSIRPGQLGVLTGIPGHGKSSWLDALVTHLAVNEEWRTGVFSPENAPLAQHFKKLAECYIGKAFFPGYSERMTPAEVATAAQFLQEHFFFISPGDDPFTIDEILRRAKVLVYRYGIQFLIIDPFNDIDLSNLKNEKETGQISLLLSKCQRFARMHNVFLCLVAHPTKLRRDEKTNSYPVPTLYDISGSAHFRNRCDIGICVHRPDMTKDFIELHIQKVRFKEDGAVGMVRLDYSKCSGRFFTHVGSYHQPKKKAETKSLTSGRDRAAGEAPDYPDDGYPE